MLKRLLGLTLAVLVTASTLTMVLPAGEANAGCTNVDEVSGQCSGSASIPPEPGKGDTESTGDHKGDGGHKGGDTSCRYGKKKVPCSRDGGKSVWTAGRQCYVSRMETELVDDPAWNGHKTGHLYLCSSPNGSLYEFWSDTAPAAQPPPNARVEAQKLLVAMGITAPQVGIVPEQGKDRVGIVGMKRPRFDAAPV